MAAYAGDVLPRLNPTKNPLAWHELTLAPPSTSLPLHRQRAG